jgi:malonate decarboxylase beta subunit
MTPTALRRSCVESTPRERIESLADPGSFREILDPFARCSSPYLAEQGVVAQRDDGVVVGRALVDGRDVGAVAVDGRFLGGSIGEIGGAKIARVLERARDGAFLLLDTGGIRLQEANLGLLAIAEICDAIVALREHAPVVAIVAGRVGCYGGMSVAAALCSQIIVSPVGRFGLNGPEVVEQEAGIEELDARDRPAIWQATGGVRRVEQRHADILIEDDLDDLSRALRDAFRASPNRERLSLERLRNQFSREAPG